MRFKSITNTGDLRLRKGVVYEGSIIVTDKGLRICVYDELGQWMTFSPAVFRPEFKRAKEVSRAKNQREGESLQEGT